MIRSVVIRVPVIRCYIEPSIIILYALDQLGGYFHAHFPQIGTAFKIISVKIASAVVHRPGAHPHGSVVRINGHTGDFRLAAFRVEHIGPCQLQCFSVIDRHLNIGCFPVHEVFNARVDLSIIHVDIANMIDFRVKRAKGLCLCLNPVPIRVVNGQRCAAGHIIETVLPCDALPSIHLMGGCKGISIGGRGAVGCGAVGCSAVNRSIVGRRVVSRCAVVCRVISSRAVNRSIVGRRVVNRCATVHRGVSCRAVSRGFCPAGTQAQHQAHRQGRNNND